MANELVVTDLLGNNGDLIGFTCTDGTAIPKGSILELIDPRAVQVISAVDKPIVGIAAFEKVANDGQTQMTAITNCIAKATTAAGGSATLGDHVSAAAGDNTVNLSSSLDVEKGWNLGYSLETVGASETFLVRVRK